MDYLEGAHTKGEARAPPNPDVSRRTKGPGVGPRPGNRQTLLISSPDGKPPAPGFHRTDAFGTGGPAEGGRGPKGVGRWRIRSCHQTPPPHGGRLHKLQCASARLDGSHKMSLMLTWLWRSGGRGGGGLRAVAFCGPHPGPPSRPPILPPVLGPDTNKRIRSPRFRQALHSRQSSEQLSVTLNDKSANLCQSLWAGIPVFEG